MTKIELPEIEMFTMRELINCDPELLKEYKELLWVHWSKVNDALKVAELMADEDKVLKSMNLDGDIND